MSHFNLKPTLSVYQHTAYPCGILENPQLPSAVLNWNIQWSFPRSKHAQDQRQFDFFPSPRLHRMALLGVFNIQKLFANSTAIPVHEALSEAIRGVLALSGYVFTRLDYYHINATAHFQKKHFVHGFLIFDYAHEIGTFRGALYTKEGNFGAIDINVIQLINALGAVRRGHWPCILAVHPQPIHIDDSPLDSAHIKVQLECFLGPLNPACANSRNSRLETFCQQSTSQHVPCVFGVSVYDEISKYFRNRFSAQRLNYDPRLTRLLWEHKKLMRLRLQRLKHETFAVDDNFLSEWQEIERLAYGVHLKAFAAKMRNDLSLLGYLIRDLDKLKTIEVNILTRLISKL